jgi:hypothetical protein
MKTQIVVDKSYLQGVPTSTVRELAATARLLVSDALFYELLTTDLEARKQCFSKFPPENNPVDLVGHIGPLMRMEISTQKRSGKPSQHRENSGFDFRFNSALLDDDYVLPPRAVKAIEEHTRELQSDVRSYIERVSLVPTFFPDLLKGTTADRKARVTAAEEAIASPRSLLPFYSSLEPPPGESALPPGDVIDESWALYRWLQVQLLFAVDVFARYQGNKPDLNSPAIFEKMEHDVLDAQVLMLACLEGAYATRETKLKRWWSLLRPDGKLYE